MTFLVTDAALHRGGAEHLVDGGPQRLATVNDEQHALLGVEATIDEVGEQVRRDGRVLGRALP